MMQIKNTSVFVGVVAIIISIAIATIITTFLYQQTVNILTGSIKHRLEAIVKTAAVQFDPNDLNALKKESDWRKPQWAKVVNQLLRIRTNNDAILFAYIFRKSPEGGKVEFVSDSHSLDPYAKIDLNHDAEIDDADQLQWPGQMYEEPPLEAFDGFDKVVTTADIYEDQWGLEISGYAPIKDDNNNTVAVLAIDMKADDFSELTRQTLFPFLIFISALISIMLALAGSLIFVWNKRVNLVVELDRQKDELLSIVSHQLATPVTSVKWYLEMLMDGDLGSLTKEQKEHVHSMEGIFVDLSDLVGMILDVSRIQLGRVQIEKKDLDLKEFFKEILEIVEPKAREKEQVFNVSIPESFPEAKLDKRYTHMTVENLLSNAIKYTSVKGKVDFKVEIRGNELFCKVKDTGCGIPKADQGKIFGKLFRASNVRNEFDGNGFGLYVAKGAVEAQGGSIWFESKEGEGTTFFIRLPLA